MADEAEQEIEQEEVAEAPVEKSPLEEFQELLDGKPEKTEEPVETEQEPGVEESAEADAVETEAVEETETVADEGPSFLMKQAAAQAGVPESLIESAPSDAHLQWITEQVSRYSGQQPEAPKEPEPLKVSLPEDEYGPDDPVRKEMQRLVDALNAERTERAKTVEELKKFQDDLKERERQAAVNELYSAFDEELDSYDSPQLGNFKKGLTTQQQAARRAIAVKYQGLGADVTTPVEDKKRKARLALEDYDYRIVEQRNKKQQAAARQPQRVTGGHNARPVKIAPSVDDEIERWNRAIEKGDSSLLLAE